MSTDVAIRWARTPLTAQQRLRSLEQLTDQEREREPSDGFLAGRLLVREIAEEVLGRRAVVTASCPDCGREHGQPRVEGLFASIAHASDLAVVAVSTEGPIGVDVERDDADVPALFADGVAGWTGIEAVLKADGRGLRVDPREVHIDGTTASLGSDRYTIEYKVTVPGFTTAVARAVSSR